MTIAICDDEKNVCSTIEQSLLRMEDDYLQTMKIFVFHRGEDLRDALVKGQEFELIFLDIEMGDLNGLDVGRLIRDQLGDEKTRIVYISWQAGYAMDLFAVRPFNFLIKPIDELKIQQVVRSANKVMVKEESYFYYTTNQTTKRVKTSAIQHFESDNRIIKMVTQNGHETFYGKLDEVLNQLDNKNFWRIHKSYIIHYNYVDFFEYHQLRMANNQVLPISQSRRKMIRQLQMNLQSGGL